MTQNSNKILDDAQIRQKIRRIAFQIYENNYEESSVIFAGIDGGGYHLAEMLYQEFKTIADVDTQLIKVILDKENPLGKEVILDQEIALVANKTVILVDDVLNSGQTLIYGLKPFLKVKLHKLEVAVLVDRSHRRFPILANYVGYTLSTTLQDHISVILTDQEKMGVYLQ
jgi:pyrimidine operon attenuation protein/uracil phosphoribosyltransferase